MDRSKEAKTSSSLVVSNGISRRRNRATTFRDSSEEGLMELQETIRLKERGSKRDRDRDFATRSKRRREDADTSAEDGDSDEVEDGVSRILSSATASSASNQRKNSLPPRAAKQQWKVVDDAMIGVPVPRKARSAKRSHDCTVSGNSGVGGAGEDIANSPAEVISPSTSIVSIKKKMKPAGPKTRKPKTSKASSSSAMEGDIEIEIAEVLYGLMKQSHCSKKQEVSEKTLPNQEAEYSSVNHGDTKSSVALTTENFAQTAIQKSVSHQNNGDISDLLLSVAVEKNKVVPHSSPLAQNDSSDGTAECESEQPTEMEIRPPKVEAASDFNQNLGSDRCQTEETKREEIVFLSGGDEITGSKKSELTQEEIAPCSKVDVDLEDSIPSKLITKTEIQKEKFKFDLMAPPTSPERDGLAEVLDAKPLSLEVGTEKGTSSKVEDKVEGFKEKAKVIDEVEDKVVKGGKSLELFKLDLEKQYLDGITMQEQSQKQQFKGTAGTIEKNEPSLSVPLPITLGGWPTAGIPTLGCMPLMPMDRVGNSSSKLQHPNFILSHPRPKRCLTHYDIARNIYLHQQFTKTNYFQPAADASASFAEGRLIKMASSESSTLNGIHLDVNLNSVNERAQAAADFPVNDKTPETANFFDMAKSKQLVFQQPQGTSFGNSVSGPGFIFPISQQQTQTAATGNQPGSTKASNSTTSLFNNPEAGKHESLPALPTVSSNMSYSHPGLISVEAPYFAKLQNNGYPFTFSTPAGATTYRANMAQTVPLYGGSFYPSQMFYPSQAPPPQNLSQTQSHKQPQAQQQWSLQATGKTLLPSKAMQLKQPMEQNLPISNQSRKHENETTGEDNTSSLSDLQSPQIQKNVYGQNYMLPVQALNFNLMPSATLSNVNGEKKQSHPQHLKSTVALVPSQALQMSFASFSGNGAPSTLNFTPTAQNTAVYQSHPSIQRTGYHVSPAPQPTKQKNHQTSEVRNGGFLSNNGNPGKASATSGQTLVFNNSGRTLNFMSSSAPGSWPLPAAIKSAASTTNRPTAGSSPGSQQQQQLLQLQQQHIMLQPQAAATMARSKAPTNNSMRSASVGTKFSYNAHGFSQSLIQSDSSVESSLQKNSGTMMASTVPMTSLHLPSSNAVHKKGQTQISFGGDFKPSFAQMQQIPSSSHSSSPLVSGSPSKAKNNSNSSKSGSSVATLQSKQDESSSTGGGQKSSPVCGRNVPSILNTCPSHLSELKY